MVQKRSAAGKGARASRRVLAHIVGASGGSVR